ncbi:hypothetical protein QJS10_CPB11g00983 [Acorus calamus]|uniref:Uncharacterized protein n=1 Tax=Acorus calamus TaxID=4465 RepID=A0AAV9DUB8_ACOCL|nr:hypothetical protein QJS10_CPB11g00983 [Acorus calamus]
MGGRLVLLQAVLSSLATFYLSIFRVPRTILAKIDAIRKRFLWNGAKTGNDRPHLVQWASICLPK